VYFELGRTYTRDHISGELGGSPEPYLPTKNGRVTYGAFKLDTNPEAPDVILPGFGPKIEESAELLARQREPIPVFIKREVNAWEYVGIYRARAISHNPDVIEEYARRAGRVGDVSMVLFLEPTRDTTARTRKDDR
jgi:hypothetical protein